jgi:hypothetical protein
VANTCHILGLTASRANGQGLQLLLRMRYICICSETLWGLLYPIYQLLRCVDYIPSFIKKIHCVTNRVANTQLRYLLLLRIDKDNAPHSKIYTVSIVYHLILQLFNTFEPLGGVIARPRMAMTCSVQLRYRWDI